MRPLILAFLLAGLSLPAQEEEENDNRTLCNDIDKKTLALYEKGIDRKKYKKPERMEFLMKALEAEPDFNEANLAMGMELVARCKLESKPFTPTIPYFMKAISGCPQVHSDPYYYIGYDYYERYMYDSARKYLDKFVAFKDGDSKKFAKEWDGQMYNAKGMLGSVKKEMSLKKNVQFDPRVVTGVSTVRDEYLAYISPDDKTCYYVRRMPVKKLDQVYASDAETEVFMYSTRGGGGQFDEGQPMGPPFNTTSDNQGGCSISIDNKHLYFAMMRQEGGLQPNCDLYVCDALGDGEWSEMRKLSANVNDPKYWDSQPTISSDGVTLYFASDRPGGYGGIDIYMTRKDPRTGEWGRPVNLGPKINTTGDEKTPFIHSDSETLYFSSKDGHPGFGDYDIMYVRKNEKGEWMEPENIGSPINEKSPDTGFFVSGDSKTGYFFSYDEGRFRGKGVGRYDLFGFELYAEARPQQVSLVQGAVKDEQGNNVSGAVVEVKDLKTKNVSLATVDSASGTYMMAVKKDRDVLVTVKKDNLAFNSKVVKAQDIPATITSDKTVDLTVQEAKEGSSFVLENLLYNTNSADLTKESHVILESFADYLNENKNIRVQISGHTDNVGNPKDNEALSTNRAFTVKAVLEEMGVAGDRITAKGYGQAKPIASNGTEEGRAKNRRTEFQILQM
jgi:outer membrane protein OmpA-like peptidoglycan-associated protein